MMSSESSKKSSATEATGQILVVDDEESICSVLDVILQRDGHAVRTASSAREALARCQSESFDLALVDIRMPEMDGIELLRQLKEHVPDMMVVVMTAYESWALAVEAMRLGAFGYIRKPFDNREIRAIAARAVGHRRLEDSSAAPGRGLLGTGVMVGAGEKMKQVYDLIRRVAPTDSTVMVRGESGTGKELVARALHYHSHRAAEPFLALNCAALTETLLESELFGHVRGAFTGAISDKKGLLEVADRGTFFLDEVSEMSPQIQVKLLRVLEEREFKPVGGTRSKTVDVRFITATNRNLEEAIATGAFRKDLYYRLNVIAIEVPPLRERREDIPLLAGHFLAKYCRAMRKEVREFSPEALQALVEDDWPGNVRELENMIQRALALAEGKRIERQDLSPQIPVSPPPMAGQSASIEVPAEGMDLGRLLEETERAYIQRALQLASGSQTEAAKLLRMSFRSFRYRAKRLGIVPARRSPEGGGGPRRPGQPERGEAGVEPS